MPDMVAISAIACVRYARAVDCDAAFGAGEGEGTIKSQDLVGVIVAGVAAWFSWGNLSRVADQVAETAFIDDVFRNAGKDCRVGRGRNLEPAIFESRMRMPVRRCSPVVDIVFVIIPWREPERSAEGMEE